MAGTYSFHVVRRETELSALGETLYADAHNRADFLRLNDSAVANGEGHLRAGQVVFLPESSCYSHESEIMETVREINHIALHRMTWEERGLLAEGYQLLDNIASNPEHIRLQQRSGAVKLLFNYGNGLAGGGIAALSLEVRLIRQLLEQLEHEYHLARRNGARLTPTFYARRRAILRTLDSRIGRAMRALATRTPYHLSARRALRISHKRNLLHWRRGGESIRGFTRHFQNISNTANVLRFGGAAVIGIDATLTMDTIQEACAAGETLECARTRAVETGGFAGRTLGGLGGGSWAAYTGCNLVFGKVSGGTSLLWCGLIGAPLGGFASSVVLGNFGERVGNWWHEARHPIRYEP